MTRLGSLRGHVLATLVNLAALAAAVWWLRAPAASAVRVLPPPTVTPAPPATPVRIAVYVTGAVAVEKVVTLAEGARASDAVAAAGGFNATADRAAVNLAATLADGAHLHVPEVGEAPRAAAVGDGNVSAPLSDSGLPVGPIDLNTATGPQLETLPGIGPALAQRILDYRAANGPFEAVRDLLAVPGVGEKTLSRFQDRVAVH